MPVHIKVEIPDNRIQLLGETPEIALQALVEKELTRLWHIERSRPREYAPGKPGRPKLSEQFKQVRALAAEILPVYDKLRRMYGEKDFERIYGRQFEQVQGMIEEQDVEGLRQWLNTQPWTKR